MREVVLFVPGTSGSYLRDRSTGALHWGTPLFILGWRNYRPMQMPYHDGMPDTTTSAWRPPDCTSPAA